MAFTFSINGHTYTSDPTDTGVPAAYHFDGYNYLTALGNLAVDIVAVAAATMGYRDAASGSAAAAAENAIAAASSAASAAAIAGAFVGTSATSWTPTVGAQAFATQTGEQYTGGTFLSLVSAADPTAWGVGQCASYTGSTLNMDIQVINGVGAHADWNISLTGTRGAKGDTGTPGSFPVGTSTTSDIIAPGDTTVTTQPGLGFVVGQEAVLAYTTTPTIKMQGTITAYNPGTGALTVFITTIVGSGTYAAWTISLTAPVLSGLQTLWVPAGAMVPRSTAGAAPGNVETATNKLMIKTLNFDTAAVEYVQFSVRMPKAWDKSTVTAAFLWSHAATATNFTVEFAIQAVAISNDDVLDIAFGAAQVIASTGGTTNDLYVSGNTPAITINGIPTDGDLIFFQAYRNVSSGSDTMAIDARLHGITVFYTLNGVSDA